MDKKYNFMLLLLIQSIFLSSYITLRWRLHLMSDLISLLREFLKRKHMNQYKIGRDNK